MKLSLKKLDKKAALKTAVDLMIIMLLIAICAYVAYAPCTYTETHTTTSTSVTGTGTAARTVTSTATVTDTRTASGSQLCGQNANGDDIWDQCDSQRSSFDQNDWTTTLEGCGGACAGRTDPNDEALSSSMLSDIMVSYPNIASETDTDRLCECIGYNTDLINAIPEDRAREAIETQPDLANAASTENLVAFINSQHDLINTVAPNNHCRVLASSPTLGNYMSTSSTGTSNLASCMASNTDLIDNLDTEHATNVLLTNPEYASDIESSSALAACIDRDGSLVNTISLTNLARALTADTSLVSDERTSIEDRLAESPTFLNSADYEPALQAYFTSYGMTYTAGGPGITAFDDTTKQVTLGGSNSNTFEMDQMGGNHWTVNNDGSLSGNTGTEYQGVTISSANISRSDGFTISGGSMNYSGTNPEFGTIKFTNSATLTFNGNTITDTEYSVTSRGASTAFTNGGLAVNTTNIVNIATSTGESYSFRGDGTMTSTGDMAISGTSDIWVDGTYVTWLDNVGTTMVFTPTGGTSTACTALATRFSSYACMAIDDGSAYITDNGLASNSILQIRGVELDSLTYNSTNEDDFMWVSYAVGNNEVLLAGEFTSSSGNVAALSTGITYTSIATNIGDNQFTFSLQNGRYVINCPTCTATQLTQIQTAMVQWITTDLSSKIGK